MAITVWGSALAAAEATVARVAADDYLKEIALLLTFELAKIKNNEVLENQMYSPRTSC